MCGGPRVCEARIRESKNVLGEAARSHERYRQNAVGRHIRSRCVHFERVRTATGPRLQCSHAENSLGQWRREIRDVPLGCAVGGALTRFQRFRAAIMPRALCEIRSTYPAHVTPSARDPYFGIVQIAVSQLSGTAHLGSPLGRGARFDASVLWSSCFVLPLDRLHA
jgi:hypothetical protein